LTLFFVNPQDIMQEINANRIGHYYRSSIPGFGVVTWQLVGFTPPAPGAPLGSGTVSLNVINPNGTIQFMRVSNQDLVGLQYLGPVLPSPGPQPGPPGPWQPGPPGPWQPGPPGPWPPGPPGPWPPGPPRPRPPWCQWNPFHPACLLGGIFQQGGGSISPFPSGGPIGSGRGYFAYIPVFVPQEQAHPLEEQQQ